MTQFSSISPIPGFRDWLTGEINIQKWQFERGAVSDHSKRDHAPQKVPSQKP
ncbi:hypothetical protein DPMN_042905 [Dreissena polymorpha]|uniref:Uncharacterized protein n=1 Tax=Dreissena polymorpha TaxID=45954 RepID=A0A9D4HXE5_DREPO|nr:hypothetical protein DPMN_042905 [Dreissena polymorpha]